MNGSSMTCRRHRTVTEVLSTSADDTQSLGARLARELPIPGVVLLRGALGVGKTTLTRGIAKGLGLKDPSVVCSPSFTLINIYYGYCRIYHVDLYRISGERDLRSVGIDEFIDKEGVTVVEWSERLTFPVPKAYWIELEDAGDDFRRIRIFRPVPVRSRSKDRRPGLKRSSGRLSRERAQAQPGRKWS